MIGVLLTLVACALAPPPDPRPDIAARRATAASSLAPSPTELEEQVLLGLLPAACVGARARARTVGADEDWRTLLLVAARARPAECLTVAEGAALVAWAAPKEGWRGARAEWVAAQGDPESALALLGPTGNDIGRLRIALARGDTAAARLAAEGALVEEPRDVLACRIVGTAALAEGDAAWAIETSSCGGLGARAPELLRLLAEAHDGAGNHAAAEEAYGRAGLPVHRAALLYQEGSSPERLAEAARLLAAGPDGRPPPATLHAVWMALLHGGTPPIDGLDASLPGALARAMARGDDADLVAVQDAPGAEAAVVRAQLYAARGDRALTEAALAEALDAAPAAEPVHRARVALLLRVEGDVGAALVDWAAQDPDHVRAVGRRGERDLPWAALVPDTWAALAARHPDARMRVDAPAGADAVGARIRTARGLSDVGARDDALAALLADVPGLDALVSERYRSWPAAAAVPERVP